MSRKRVITESNAPDISISLEGLLKHSWHVWHTSLSINRNEETLKRNSVLISKMILTAMHKCKSCSVQLTRCKEIRRDETSSPALLVEILLDNEATPTFLGYFMNWATESVEYNESEPLPLFLYRSRKKSIAKSIIIILKKIFDFNASPVHPDTQELAKFMAVFLKCADDGSQEKKAQLKYSVPLMTDKERITVSTSLRGLSTVFNFILETVTEEEDIVKVFYDKLLNHYRMVYRLHLNKAHLRDVIFPHATITRDGQIKIDDLNTLAAAFSFLQSISAVNIIEHGPI